MSVYKNYLSKDSFSSFSQLNIDQPFYKMILIPLLGSISKPVEGRGTEHKSEEFSILMFLNALLGYNPNQGSQVLKHKLYSILKNELSYFIKDTRILPRPSQMIAYTRRFSMEEGNNIFLKCNKEIFSYLFEKRFLPKKIKLAFDFKKKLYYGEKEDSNVIGIKSDKGTIKVNFWHTCAIALKGRELQIGSEMVEKRDKKVRFIRSMVHFCISLGFTVEMSVLDKEYYAKEIITFFYSQEIIYIIPVRESERLRSLKEEALSKPK